jgi:flagellar protein FliO/FliZ
MDLEVYFRFLLALAFVLGLIMALAWAARRFGFGGSFTSLRNRSTRLSVSETLMLDGKRRLVLVRRDDREHLLILGPAGETVVESGIPALASAPAIGGVGESGGQPS